MPQPEVGNDIRIWRSLFVVMCSLELIHRAEVQVAAEAPNKDSLCDLVELGRNVFNSSKELHTCGLFRGDVINRQNNR